MKVYWGMGHLEKNKFEITSLKGKWIPRKEKAGEEFIDCGEYYIVEDVFEQAWERECTYIRYIESPTRSIDKDKTVYLKTNEKDGYLICNDEEKKELDRKFRKRWFF